MSHKRNILLTSAIAAALAIPSLAMAGPGGKGHRGKGKRGHRVLSKQCLDKHYQRGLARLTKLDLNGDGEVGPKERQAARKARRQVALSKYDKDGNGKLSKAERKELRHDRMVKKFEKVDTNSDARISKAEAKSSCSPMSFRFKRFDTDNDGFVTWTEFEAKAKKHMKRRRGNKARRGNRANKRKTARSRAKNRRMS